MPAHRKDLSLKWLELFQICARKGSLQDTAAETGLSISTVSHHLKSLEDHLGIALFDHSRRPMVLTPKGHVFLRNIDDALLAIRKAQAEASSGNLIEARYLRIGSIEDFDSDITPALAVHLARLMPECDFLYHTASSRDVLAKLRDRKLDMGITVSPPERLRDLEEKPLLRDPFAVVLPAKGAPSVDAIFAGTGDLPFLQFTSDLIIAQQIEAQLARLGITIPRNFACDSNQTLMAMVAAGAGWTITTPLLFARARRFQPDLVLHPFPGKSFGRRLSLVWTPDCARSVLRQIDTFLRARIEADLVSSMHAQAPWLKGQFGLID
ncbi:LysR family transcriptional regulator [Cognatishimia sp. D5M38]|uniref:LysR family transcriptional regulator n=1 Tax=Cognatishimia coralii TaxID=3083254 RepID=A0ABU8QJG5_9RHOB